LRESRKRERVCSGGAAKEREKHTMAVEEEHAIASRLLIVWRESCKRELVEEHAMVAPRRTEREGRCRKDKNEEILALDFFLVFGGCCRKTLQYFSATVPLAFKFFLPFTPRRGQ
jgi:hypothetical protein